MKNLSSTIVLLSGLARGFDFSDDAGGGLRSHRGLVALDIEGIALCTSDKPCGRCEGDCRRDEDCAGDLVCYNVAGRHKPGDFCATIPGCAGEDLSKTDWCIRPEDMPDPNLCDTPAEAAANKDRPVVPYVPEPEEPTIGTASCADLETLVFDLTTKINDVEVETARYEVLTEELAQTAGFGDPEGLSQRFLNDRDAISIASSIAGEVESSLNKLIVQEERLSVGNLRFTELNTVIRGYLGFWKDENGNLMRSVNTLTQENALLVSERDELSLQIDDLSSNINELQDLVNNQGDLNDDLDESVSSLEAEIERLKAENDRYQNLNNELSSSIEDLQNQVWNLEDQNTAFAELNAELLAIQEGLDNEVDELREQNEVLASNVDDLEASVDQLSNYTGRLEEANDDLEENVGMLQDKVDSLEENVGQLEQLNGQLETIASFISETGIGIEESYEQVTEFLAEQIVGYRSVAQETLQNTYIQRVSLWDCAYRDYFADYDFAFKGTEEIPEQDVEGGVFDRVIDYIDERVLGELCLSVEDFEEYLEETFDEPVYTSNHLISGINSYSDLVFDYYFPDASDTGASLTPEDWAMAGYDCNNLPADQKYRYNSP